MAHNFPHNKNGNKVVPTNAIEDAIRIERIKAFGYHGVLSQERELGQNFFVSLEIRTSFAECTKTDDLSKTINYAEVVTHVCEIVSARPPFFLIETLAEKIAQSLLDTFPRITSISVEIHKPDAPIHAEFADISVRITRNRK